MPTDQQQALTLIKLINNWALIDISLDPSAVTTLPSESGECRAKYYRYAASTSISVGRPPAIFVARSYKPSRTDLEQRYTDGRPDCRKETTRSVRTSTP